MTEYACYTGVWTTADSEGRRRQNQQREVRGTYASADVSQGYN
jgi:hypothetical protein